MRVELLNWSGHKNLGDDVMADILLEHFPGAVNMGETFTDYADWYIFGGGTLISPGSLYFNLIKHPEKTIGISLGVSSNWNGEWLEVLQRIKRIYVRDEFSQKRLKDFGVDSILSVDLFCALDVPQERKSRFQTWVCPYMFDFPKGDKTFVVAEEDRQFEPEAEYYADVQKLLKDLIGVRRVIAGRLHANIAAWLAEVPQIYFLSSYDYKVFHFYERVKDLTPREAKSIIFGHLREIKDLIE